MNIDWFIGSDSSVLCRLGSRKNSNALFILFWHFPLFSFMLFCQNVATITTDRKEASGLWLSLSCPVLFGLYKLVFSLSCPALSCLVLSLPGAGGKGDLSPPRWTPSPNGKRKQIEWYVHKDASQYTQKNADSLYKSPPSLDAHAREGVLRTQTHIHTHRRRPCVVTGDDKWSGRHSSVSSLAYGWPDGQD